MRPWNISPNTSHSSPGSGKLSARRWRRRRTEICDPPLIQSGLHPLSVFPSLSHSHHPSAVSSYSCCSPGICRHSEESPLAFILFCHPLARKIIIIICFKRISVELSVSIPTPVRESSQQLPRACKYNIRQPTTRATTTPSPPTYNVPPLLLNATSTHTHREREEIQLFIHAIHPGHSSYHRVVFLVLAQAGVITTWSNLLFLHCVYSLSWAVMETEKNTFIITHVR